MVAALSKECVSVLRVRDGIFLVLPTFIFVLYRCACLRLPVHAHGTYPGVFHELCRVQLSDLPTVSFQVFMCNARRWCRYDVTVTFINLSVCGRWAARRTHGIEPGSVNVAVAIIHEHKNT